MGEKEDLVEKLKDKEEYSSYSRTRQGKAGSEKKGARENSKGLEKG